MRGVRVVVRGVVAELSRGGATALVLAAAVARLCAPADGAATPAPQGSGNLSHLIPKAATPMLKLPATAQHTEFVVETNDRGQVTRVRSGKSAKDANFNAMTYGNALQAFIRTPDGHALAGTYRLTYDYVPAEKRVKRDVALIRAGGVNPKAQGAVDEMAEILRKRAEREAAAKAKAKTPASPLPSFEGITGHQ